MYRSSSLDPGIDVVSVVEFVGKHVDPRSLIGHRVIIDPTMTFAGNYPVRRDQKQATAARGDLCLLPRPGARRITTRH